MLYNEFIDKMLVLMSHPINRLRNPVERMTIQFNLQNTYLYKIFEYFMQIKTEYKYNWYIFQCNENRNEKYLKFNNVSHYYEFQEFYDYMITNNVFNFDEAEWLEDAIHEILVE